MAMLALTDPEARAGVLLAHLSDPHLPLAGRVPLRAVLNKRALGLLSWRLKRHRRHRPAILAALVADMQAHEPDLIAVTGDLTNLGLEAEYRAALDWLGHLGEAMRVMTIPGNHDALVTVAWPRGAGLWQPYWQGDAPPQDGDAAQAFPTLRRRGALALVGVSSAVPSAPGLAVGEVGEAQIARLGAMLRRTRAEGLFRLVMIHHPPLAGTVSRRKHLRDHAEVRALLEREGVEMVLHGHSHRSHHRTLATRDGDAPVIGVPSASSMHHEPAAYNLCRIVPGDAGWQVTVSPRRLAAGGVVEAGGRAAITITRAHAA